MTVARTVVALGRVASLVLVGCGTEPTTTRAPVFAAVVASERPENVLSALIRAAVDEADSLIIRYGSAAPGTSLDSATPAFPYQSPGADLPLLGLLPDHAYRLQVAAYRGNAVALSQPIAFATGSLPDDLPQYAAQGTSPSPGFVIFAAGSYVLALDNTGRVVWYHRLVAGPSLNFMAQPNGRFVARPVTPDRDDIEGWIEFDALGRVTRKLGCAGGLVARPHDLIALADGSVWLLCDDTRVMDLSHVGGLTASRVTGTAIQHVGASGELLFEWTPFAHFALEDVPVESLLGEAVNWTHGNALDLSADGTLVVSFRNLGEITGIDTRTGAVRWRLGGARSEFTLRGESAPPFIGQHGVRATDRGLLLLDNLGTPGESRVEHYELDFAARTATLVAALRPSLPVVAHLGGTTQQLANGHTLVSFGNGRRVEEYDRDGRVVWKITGDPGYVFRAQRIASLYVPAVAHR